jgi:hypothetical protein
MGDDQARKGQYRMLDVETPARGLELELDVKSKEEVRISAKPNAAASSFRPDPRGVAVAVGIDRVALSKPPLPVDNIEAKLLGNFGPVPTAIWQLPGYARHVAARLAELDAALGTREVRARRAQKDLDDASVSLARRGVTACNALTRQARAGYLPTLEQLAKREAHLRDVDSELAGAMKEHQSKVEALEKRSEVEYAELTRARAAERAAGGDDPAAKNSPALAAAKKKVAECERKLEIIRDEKNTLEQSARDLRGAASPAVEAARADYASICADLAQFIAEDRINFGAEFDDARQRLAKLREVSQAADKELALYRAATQSYDAGAVAKGKQVLYGSIVGAALFVIVIIAIIAIK